MRRLRAQFQPDILHLNGSALISAGAAGRLLGIPVIWHVREMLGSDLSMGPGRRCAPPAPGAASGMRFRGAIGWKSRGNIQVVYNSIYLDDFQPRPPDPAARHEFDIPDSAQVVGYVGRIIPPKGLSELATRPLSWHKRRWCISCWWAAGKQTTGKARRAYRRAWPGRPFPLRGRAPGYRKTVYCHGLVTLPSWSEGLGRVVIEALAMEKPMVASRLGPIAEMITDEVNGLLVAPRSPDQLAQGILRFLLTPEFARACAAAGRNVVVDRFRTDAYVRRMLQVYGKILLQGRAIRGKPLVRPRADED